MNKRTCADCEKSFDPDESGVLLHDRWLCEECYGICENKGCEEPVSRLLLGSEGMWYDQENDDSLSLGNDEVSYFCSGQCRAAWMKATNSVEMED